MCDPMRVHVIISFGDCSVSLFCPMYWAVLQRSAGGTTISICNDSEVPFQIQYTMGSKPNVP